MLENTTERESVRNRNGRQRQKRAVKKGRDNVNLKLYSRRREYRTVLEVTKQSQW